MTTEKPPSPSAFMRKLRPELYSDTEDRTAYALNGPEFDHHLETLTARNQTRDFEIFCRKLCERVICPNLRPPTGPEGGGDGKVDSETLPLAEEIATLTYVAEPEAGNEKWAFAFSANKDWKKKARNDIKGIAETKRGYKRAIFVTSQYAKGNTRADLEKELTDTYGLDVTIYDRSWIMQQVLERDCKDLAFNYLRVGQEVSNPTRLGPSDYSRTHQLEDIEKALAKPDQFTGMKIQEATEALLAAKLSRGLERPRPETEGRFARAIRLADAYGTARQKLEARYESLWTAVWWFDDIDYLNASYDEFEGRVIGDDNALNLEFLSNLLQMLFNAVINNGYTVDRCKLVERSSRLYARLDAISADRTRPNNALEAKTLRLIGRLNVAIIEKDGAAIESTWPELSAVLKTARGLGEFNADQLVKLIGVMGGVAGDSAAYGQLVEETAAFVADRTSETEGALILMRRAQQIDPNDHFEIIRLLGKAAIRLTKKEHVETLIEALQLLAVAYSGAGLFWAARATCVSAAASISIKGEEDSELDVGIVPTFTIFAQICLRLRHVPDFLHAIQFLNGGLAVLPLADASKEHLKKRLEELDLTLGSGALNCSSAELDELSSLPDIFAALGLMWSRSSLLYVLGYEPLLRKEGWIPSDETAPGAASLFDALASQPVSDDIRGPLIVNPERPHHRETNVLGIRIRVAHEGDDVSIQLAEATLASIEACFATAVELKVHPHTEIFDIQIIEDAVRSEPAFEVDAPKLTAKILWPKGASMMEYVDSQNRTRFLIQVAMLTMAATCLMREGILDQLASSDAVMDRITMIAVSPTSYHRLLSRKVSRLADWQDAIQTDYPRKEERPSIKRVPFPERDLEEGEIKLSKENRDAWLKRASHRNMEVRSVIDLNLWNAAGWRGALYQSGGGAPPVLALLFADEAAARGIFERWRERFGPIDKDDAICLSVVENVSAANPAHYSIVVHSNLDKADASNKKLTMMLTRIQRMQPDTDINLRRFLRAFEEAGVYLIAPAMIVNGAPRLFLDLAICKRNLARKSAPNVGENEIEYAAIAPEAEAHFEAENNPAFRPNLKGPSEEVVR